MRKGLKALLLLISLVCITALAACDDHVHQRASAWTTDSTSHWKTCEGCDELLYKANHTYGDWTIIKEATATTAGSKKHACTVCAYEQEETIPATGSTHTHTYGDWIVVTEATATTAGLKKRVCSCGEEETEVIPATGSVHTHTYGEWIVVTEATATTAGLKKRVCSCGEEETEVIPATGETHTHTYGEWTVVTEATCTVKGKKTRTCSGCNEVEEQEIPMIPHVGVTECEICHTPLISVEFYTKMVTSLVNSKISIVARDLTLQHLDENVELVLGEIVLSLDENNKLYGVGRAELTRNVQLGTTPFSEGYEITCIIKDDKIYAYQNSSSDKLYAIMELNKDCPIQQLGVFNQIYSVLLAYQTSVVPALKDMLAQDMASNQVVLGIINKLFEMQKTEDGYSLVLDYAAIKEINATLSTLTVEGLVNTILGDEMYASIIEFLPIAFTSTIGSGISVLEQNGITLEMLVGLADKLLPYIAGAEVTLDEMLTAMGFIQEGTTTVDFLRSDAVKKLTIVEFAKQYFNQDITGVDVQIVSMLQTYKDLNVYELIVSLLSAQPSEPVAPMSEADVATQLKEMIDQLLDMAATMVDVTIYTSASGDVLKYGIDVTGLVIQETTIDLSLELAYDYESSYDYDADLAEILDLIDSMNLSKAVLETLEGTVVTIDENGYYNVAVTEEEIVGTETSVEGDVTSVQTAVRAVTYTYIIPSLNMLEINEVCGPWYEIYTLQISSSMVEKYLVRTEQYQNDVLISEKEEIIDEHENGYGNSLKLYYNADTNEVTYTAHDHNYIIDESKSIPAVGCTGVGLRYMVCSECAKVYKQTYTNGHRSFHIISTQFLSESNDCEDGVIVTFQCDYCDLTHTEEFYGHRTFEEAISLDGYGCCEDHQIYLSKCPCGKSQRLEYSGYFECQESDRTGYDEKLSCADCNLTIYYKESYSEIVNCTRNYTINYAIYVGDELVKQLTIISEKTEHSAYNYYTQLVGESCLDGIIFIGECTDCGFYRASEIEYPREHYTEYKYINISKYTGYGRIEIYKCACSENIGYCHIDGYISYNEQVVEEERKVTSTYGFDNGSFARITTIYNSDEKSIFYLQIELGYDITTGEASEMYQYGGLKS